MKSVKALFLFTLLWSTVAYFQLKKNSLGSAKNPVKVWVLAHKKKAVYFRAKELVRNLQEKTGLSYQWKVVFSKKEAMESLSLARIDVLLNLEDEDEKVMKSKEVNKTGAGGGDHNSLMRNPAGFAVGHGESIKKVQFRKALPKRISYHILKGLKK